VSPEFVLYLALAICVVGVVLGAAYLWFLTGARIIAAGWIWREFLRGLRSGSRSPSGGRGGHSPDYTAFMQSATWKAQRRRVLQRDGRRCRDCGGRAVDVHHEFYAAPIAATPDWALTAVCEPCHAQRHGR
jgi:5-methylcytosine-specific restriction endonuclease McrA